MRDPRPARLTPSACLSAPPPTALFLLLSLPLSVSLLLISPPPLPLSPDVFKPASQNPAAVQPACLES